MIIIGLTGSIGMGKSVIASMLETLGVPTHDADEEVRNALSPGGKGFRAVAAAFPSFRYARIYGRARNGTKYIRRKALADLIFKDDQLRGRLEGILHPLVREAQNEFIRMQRKAGKELIALDIPLLFETGGEHLVDVTLVASAPYAVQRRRVLERPGMNEEKFHAILKRQMPDGEKRARADYVAFTGLGRAETMKRLKKALREIRARGKRE